MYLFQSISPGITATELFEAAGTSYDYVKSVHDNHMPVVLSEDIADGVLYILSTPPSVNVILFYFGVILSRKIKTDKIRYR